jgi:hypothetical protein
MRPAGAHRARERRIAGDWRIRNESPSAVHSMSKDMRFEQKQISRHHWARSALPLKADSAGLPRMSVQCQSQTSAASRLWPRVV